MTAHPLIDIGANLTNRAFRHDLEAVLQRAVSAGVAAMIVTGTCEASSRAALELTRSLTAELYCTAGVHPHHAGEAGPETLDELRALARDPKVVAIGETGLDFNRDFSPRPIQEKLFAQQLELACEMELPVFLHQRDAHDRFLPLLRQYRDRLKDGVVHCFTGSRAELWAYLDLDLHIGITGWIADERRGGELRELVADIPAERLLVETDAPYLVPRDLRPKPRNGRNEPAFLPHIVDWVARCAGRSPQAVAEASTAAARRMFGLGAAD